MEQTHSQCCLGIEIAGIHLWCIYYLMLFLITSPEVHDIVLIDLSEIKVSIWLWFAAVSEA